MEAVRKTRRDTISILSLHNPPVNGLGHLLRAELAEALREGIADENILGFVLIGVGKMFSAGADIREFGTNKATTEPTLRQLIEHVEDSPKPVVAAIHGVAAGGGLELALACHARVSDSEARLGLPEVTLGIIPGAGGTQRLPRLVGIERAASLIVGGKLIPAREAADSGMVDEIVTGPILELQLKAIAEAMSLVGPPLTRTRDRDYPATSNEVERARQALAELRQKIAKKTRGFDAPLAAIEAIEGGLGVSFDQALRLEREIFQRLLDSPQSEALRHVFFAEREAGRIPGIARSLATRPIERAAVIGCGTMGTGIAMCFADAGLPVTIDNAQDALDKGLARIRASYQSSVEKGRISRDEAERRLQRIACKTGSTSGSGDEELTNADIVVEAVFEDMDVKKRVFADLDAAASAQAILATNSSSLDIDELAQTTSRPNQVIGTHFFSPAHVMKLLEVVRGQATSDEVITSVMRLAKRLGKIGVLVGVCDGFVGNRMLYAYRRQADFLIEEGALPQDVDRVLFEFGLPMGPFAMADLAGLDIGWSVRKRQALTRPAHLRYSPVADRLCEQGRFGQKTGAGWYRYDPGSRTPIADPSVERLIEETSVELGIERRRIEDQEILERCLYALINEGAQILDEGVAIRASDVDLIWVHGYGFPRYRGGPMFYADRVGLATIHQAMVRYHAEQGEWMKPAPLLERLAESGSSFHQLSPPKE